MVYHASPTITSGIDWSTLDAALDILCPLHLRLTETGHIAHVGPTLKKLKPEQEIEGSRFLDVFRLDRPRAITTMAELMARERNKLHLEMRQAPSASLKGLLVRLPKGQGALVDLSFGISVVEGVQNFGLSSSDFAATDLAIEMLYLVEAKTAAMEASRQLNQRLQGAKIAAEEQAATDPLTQLKNRRAADSTIADLITQSREFALLHVDLDRFKTVNDTMGHAAGDHVLQVVARVMRAETRKADFIARVGGDEFIVLIDAQSSKSRLGDIARRIIRGIEKPIVYDGSTFNISASIGIAIHSAEICVDRDELIARSDNALYAAKKGGRGHAVFFDEIPP